MAQIDFRRVRRPAERQSELIGDAAQMVAGDRRGDSRILAKIQDPLERGGIIDRVMAVAPDHEGASADSPCCAPYWRTESSQV